jgi:hypothetical protein
MTFIQVPDKAFGVIGSENGLIISSADGKTPLISIGKEGSLKVNGPVSLASSALNEKSVTINGDLAFADAVKSQLNVSANDRLVFAEDATIVFAAPENAKSPTQLNLASIDCLMVSDDGVNIEIKGESFEDIAFGAPTDESNTVMPLVSLLDKKANELTDKVQIDGMVDNIVTSVELGSVNDDGSIFGINGYSIKAYSDALEDDFDITGVSKSFLDAVDDLQGNEDISDAQKDVFTMLAANYNADEDGYDNGDIARSLSRSTVDERNRVTLKIADLVRDAVYSHLSGSANDREIWIAGMGDLVRQKPIKGYGMRAGLWGATIGFDTSINDDWTLGLMTGYSHASVRYNGKTLLDGNNGNQRSFFGGIYGEWDSLVRDLNIKFAGLIGHSKYKEWGNRPMAGGGGDEEDGDEEGGGTDIGRFHASHKGYWLSFDANTVWLPWEFKIASRAIKMGPWLDLNYGYVRQKGGTESISSGDDGGGEDGIAYGKSRRHAFSSIIGAHAETEFSFGKIFAEVGYKREWLRKLRVGESEFMELAYTPEKAKISKNSGVIRLGYNLSRDNWGLNLGLETQLGKKWKDYSGNISASYSF